MKWAAILAVLLLAAAPLAAELPLHESIAYGPAPGDQYWPVVATNGAGHLVVWTDGQSGNTEIWARGIEPGGEPRVEAIRVGSGSTLGAALIWAGTGYMLLFTDHRDCWALLLDSHGFVIAGRRRILANASSWSAVSGTNDIVITYTTPSEQRALFLSFSGQTTADLYLSARASVIGPVVVRSAPYTAVWKGPGGIEAIRFNRSGPLDEKPRLLFEDASVIDLHVQSAGADFLVVGRSATDGLFTRRISADLNAIGPRNALPFDSESFSIVPAGAVFILITKRQSAAGVTVHGLKLDDQGRPIAEREIETIAHRRNPARLAVGAASSSAGILIVYSNGPPAGFLDVFHTVVATATLQPRRSNLPYRLSTSVVAQTTPVLVAGPASVLALWLEGGAGGYELWARRLTHSGKALDAEPVHLAFDAVGISAVFNGRDYIVAWAGRSPPRTTIVTGRIHEDGPLRIDGSAELSMPYDAWTTKLASNGFTTFLVIGTSVFRISDSASFIDTVPLDLPAPPMDIAASYRGGPFLAVWHDSRQAGHGNAPNDIRGSRITNELTNLDPLGFDISVWPDGEYFPKVVWNGQEWLVIWGSMFTVRGRRVTTNGTVLDGGANAPGVLVSDDWFFGDPNSFWKTPVAWDGKRYIALWTDLVRSQPRTLMGIMSRLGERMTSEIVATSAGIGSLAAVGPGAGIFGYTRPVYGVDSSTAVWRAFVDAYVLGDRRRSVR